MAQTNPRPQLVQPRAMQTLEAVRSVTGGTFDPDAWHVMDARDNELVSNEILHGAGSSTFVYDFEVAGKQVSGVSVVGARHLAAHYRGLKHRLVASMQKSGELFVFQSFPAENMPMAVSASVVTELAAEPDFYSSVVEVTDIKTGNAIQIERREARYETRRDGSRYERPNYTTIAQSKAYRNAVLALVPQDVIIRWKAEMLKLRKSDTITSSVIDEKRQNVLRFAAQHSIALDRRAVQDLTLDQIAGLGDAAREGALPAFANSARALGLEIAHSEADTESGQAAGDDPQAGAATPRRRGRPPGSRNQQPASESENAKSGGNYADPMGEPERPAEDEKPDEPQPPRQRRVDFEV
jgi:hypothetical protein